MAGKIFFAVPVVSLMALMGVCIAGDLDSPGDPAAGSGMYSLEDVYQRLSTGAAGSNGAPFTEPSSGPGATGHDTNDIMSVAPEADNANGAAPGQVLSGKTYWGLRTDGSWGPGTGSLQDNGALTITPGTSEQSIPAGYHDGSGKVTGDADLQAGNIKNGVNLFGVAGSVLESTGDAAAGDVLTGKTFSRAAAAGLTGTMPNRAATNITPSASNQYISAGYHNGSGVVQGDVDLVSTNIRRDVTIFGVSGHSYVVDTSSGDAVEGNILSGKKAWVKGLEITGSMAGRALSAESQAVNAGYYADTTLSAVDQDLTPWSIKSGVTIFGVTGTCYRLPATGQTTSYSAGDDGAYHLGCAPVVPLAAGADGGGYNRTNLPWAASGGSGFVNQNDGTVLDTHTGLIWLWNASCFSKKTWTDALATANSLSNGTCGLSDGSVAGQWRLPNVNELRSLIDPAREDPALPSGHPFSGAQLYDGHWSSTTYPGEPGFAWAVYLYNGLVYYYAVTNTQYVWPVRAGQ